MSIVAINPINTEEKLVWISLVFSYVFYLSGTLYIVGALLGWVLFLVMLIRWFVDGKMHTLSCIPVMVWVWVVGMGFMLVALIVGHIDFGLSTAQIVKSSIGWVKGWALLALFPLMGATVYIRPQLVTRACCLLASQSVLFVGIGMLFVLIGFNGHLYVSPLSIIGGPISAFEVNLFGLNPESGRARWSFFTPWAPAAGLLSCLLLIICSQEKNKFWRRSGLLGALVMCLFSQSRTGWAIFLVLLPSAFVFRALKKPILVMAAGIFISGLFIVSVPVIETVNQAQQDVKDSRPGSTRVRSTLATIALQRWESEAPIWGHGIVERGPKMVEYMPIGSHHSWYGLLFVKGGVGFLALAVPMITTLFYLVITSIHSNNSQPALLILLVLIGYSFFENLEILAYLFWPALLWLGMVLNPLKSGLFDQPLKGVAA